MNDSWIRALEHIKQFKDKDNARILVIGANSVGKSSFCAKLCSELSATGGVEKSADVLKVDLDTSKPEFGPPGVIYIASVRSNEAEIEFSTEFSAFVGEVNIRNDHEIYLKKIAVIEKALRGIEKDSSTTTVIDSYGWASGLASIVLSKLLDIMKPNIVVHMTSSTIDDFLEIPKIYQEPVDGIIGRKLLVKVSAALVDPYVPPAEQIRSEKLMHYFLSCERKRSQQHSLQSRFFHWFKVDRKEAEISSPKIFSSHGSELTALEAKNLTHCIVALEQETFLGLAIVSKVTLNEKENQVESVEVLHNLDSIADDVRIIPMNHQFNALKMITNLRKSAIPANKRQRLKH